LIWPPWRDNAGGDKPSAGCDHAFSPGQPAPQARWRARRIPPVTQQIERGGNERGERQEQEQERGAPPRAGGPLARAASIVGRCLWRPQTSPPGARDGQATKANDTYDQIAHLDIGGDAGDEALVELTLPLGTGQGALQPHGDYPPSDVGYDAGEEA